jgi:predicted ATPase
MIKRIKITDFKSIRELDLALDPVTVIVGRSGTGKSNFVQAIRFLRNFLLNPEQAANYEWGWDRIVPVGEKKPRTSIEVTFSIPSSDQEYVYGLYFGSSRNQRSYALNSEILRLGDEVVFSRNWKDVSAGTPRPAGLPGGASWNWKKAPNIANLSPHQDDNPMLGSFPSLTKTVDAYAALSNGIGYYHFPATALAWERQTPPHLEFLKSVPGLADDANNYREILRRITQDFHRPDLRQSLLASLKAVNPSIASIQLDSLTKPSKTIVAHEAGGQLFELPLEAESDGLRRFYAHLLALYQTPAKLTLIFEEPENAIFPGALSLLADEFKAAPRENRGQVIITTHSPMLLDSFDVENVRVVEMRDGKTVIGSVSKDQQNAVRSRLLTTGELLTVDQAKIENAEAA